MEPFALLAAVLSSPWLVPAMVLMVAVDGPLPMLPSETVLLSATASAVVTRDLALLSALFLAAASGSVLGDLATHALGRGSHRLLPRTAHADGGIARWVRANLFRRPVAALVAARFLPGGRLLSCAAAGRMGLPRQVFLRASAVSALAWSLYMFAIGAALGPVTGGNPLLCVVAGGMLAVLTTGAFAVAQRVRSTIRRTGPAPLPQPAG
ncbi:VTT domain-containing protein [Pseudonocardia nematodicida]|uniref:VTT domain-containing protein n=1 Tax=Pseudonocardia nematodicida TaxID=1206997 RepID=A0ABV1KGN6_9PSEU